MRFKHNFNPGPAVLPEPVLAEAARAVLELDDTGISILETSHRSREFQSIIEEAEHLLRELMNIPDSYEVLFLQGGARLQFGMIPLYFLKAPGEKAGYVDTGVWARKAFEEARKVGNAIIVASSKDDEYRSIPLNFDVPSDIKYLHITSNNTIYGTQWWRFPESPVPVIADMSSDILSRPIDVSQFAMIYAGAQKNAGTAGVTIVILNREFMETGRMGELPEMLDYSAHARANSLLNTPPVFSVYVTLLTLRWLKHIGGVQAVYSLNQQKASLIYQVIDTFSEVYEGHARPEARSIMNVTFRLRDPRLEAEFLKVCQSAGIVGIKGHRSVGGFRASLYNALSIESVKVLAEVMEDFAKRKG